MDEVEKTYEKALEIQRVLVSETGSIVDRRNLACVYNNLGVLLLDDLGKLDEAKKNV